jgi:UDPglucose 6-dehydrogenase
MKITVIGTGYVGLVRHLPGRSRQRRALPRRRPGQDPHPRRRRHPDLRTGPAGHGPPQRRRRPPALHHRYRKAAVQHGTIQFIAVGTPPDEDGSADLQYVLAAARNIGRHMTDYKVVVDKSTVPVGTADKVKAAIAEELKKRAVDIPLQRRLQPGIPQGRRRRRRLHAPDRIVVGADDEQAIHLMRALYAPFQRNHERLIVMDVKSAELTKYAANAMLATRISFMNELANLAESSAPTSRWCARASAPIRASATTSSTPAAATAAPAFPRTSRP